jgi:hypothetical protein
MEHLIVKGRFAPSWSTIPPASGRPDAAPLTELVILVSAITLGSA